MLNGLPTVQRLNLLISHGNIQYHDNMWQTAVLYIIFIVIVYFDFFTIARLT